MKVLIHSGSRGEWGYYSPVIRELKRRQIDFDVLFSNMAPLDEFGNLKNSVKNELLGVRTFRIYCSHHGDDLYAMAKSFSSLCVSLSDHLANHNYDFVLIAGDRFEQLAMASVAHFMSIPVGHIQAGELSGNIDGVTRHAIGKLVHLHFAANEDARVRLLNLGEQAERTLLTGAPQLDDLFDYGDEHSSVIDSLVAGGNPFILCIYHGVTEELKNSSDGFKNLMRALNQSPKPIVFIKPNNDAGGLALGNIINEKKRAFDFSFKNLDRNDFLYLLKNAHFLVGNSSCGILEAPVFKQVAINIGGRQRDRVQGSNVVNCGYSYQEILEAFIKAEELKKELEGVSVMNSPYGSEPAAKKIVEGIIDSLGQYSSFLIRRDISR